MKSALSFVRRKSQFQENSDEFLVWNCLLDNISFKLDRRAENDSFIGFKEFIRVLKRMRAKGYSPIELTSFDTILLYYKKGNQQLALDYVEKSSGEKMGKIIWKGSLTGNPYSVLQSIDFFFLGLFLGLGCFISKKNRVNRALMLRDIYESDACVKLVSNLGGKKVFDFLPYEKDANLTSYLLRQLGVSVTFIPSVNPLRDHNFTMIADDIVLVTPYQEEEMNLLFTNTIRCNRILKWIPEAGYTYIERYMKTGLNSPSFELGFYSHGSWARNEENHLGSAESLKLEEWVLQNIAQLLDELPHLKVLLFLHPKEKKMNIESVLSYYRSVLGNRFEVASLDQRSVDQFEKVDVGLASYSSIVYERLFAGYKMIVGSYTNDGFPLKGSTLTNIYFTNYAEFRNLVLDALSADRELFFKKNNLSNYHFSSYTNLPKSSEEELAIPNRASREVNK